MKLVWLVLLVGMLQGQAKAVGCGDYGPLQWYNEPPNNVETALWGSPFGALTGPPLFFGCAPSSALLVESRGSNTFNFSYSSSYYLETTKSPIFNITASYVKSSGEPFISTVDIQLERGESLQEEFTYDSSGKLTNHTETSDDRKLAQGLFQRRRRHTMSGLLPLFSEILSKTRAGGRSLVKTTTTQIYTYASQTLPNQPSQVAEYRNLEKDDDSYFVYTLTKGNLIEHENVTTVRKGENTTREEMITYNQGYTLVVKWAISLGKEKEEVSFQYDSSNRLTQMVLDARFGKMVLLSVQYSSSGNVQSFQNYVDHYNITFFYTA